MQRSLRGLAALSALVIVIAGCATVRPAPPPLRTLPPTTAPAVTLPPTPSMPAEIQLPRRPVPNPVYDLGRCDATVTATPPADGYAMLVYAFDMNSQPIVDAEVTSESVATVKTDAKGIARTNVPLAAKSMTVKSGTKTPLGAPISGKAGECRIFVAYFG